MADEEVMQVVVQAEDQVEVARAAQPAAPADAHLVVVAEAGDLVAEGGKKQQPHPLKGCSAVVIIDLD